MEMILQSTPFVGPPKYIVLINKVIKGTCPTSFGKMCHLQGEKKVSFEKKPIATGKLLFMRFFGL